MRGPDSPLLAGPAARVGVFLLVTAVAFHVSDYLGALEKLWAQTISLVIGLWASFSTVRAGSVPAGPGTVFALVFLAYLGLSGAFHGISYLAAITWTKLAVPVLIFLAAAGERDVAGRRALSTCLALVTMLSCAVGWVQLQWPGMPASWVDPALYQHVTVRVWGIFANPNLFGAYLAMVIPIHVEHYLLGESSIVGLVDGLAAGLGLSFLLYTFSRGAWIATAFGLTILLGMHYGRAPRYSRGRLMVLLLGALVAASAVAPALWERLVMTRQTGELGLNQRKLLFEGVVAGIRSHPWIGSGLGCFSEEFPRYRLQGGYYPRDGHSSLLHIAFEVGVPGALLYLMFLGAVVLPGVQSARAPGEGGELLDSRCGAIAGSVAGLVVYLSVSGVAYLQLDAVFAAILALAHRPGRRRISGWATGSLLLASTAGVALYLAVAVTDTAWGPETNAGQLDRLTGWMGFREDLWYRLAQARLAAKDPEGAAKALDRALTINPANSRIYVELASVRLSTQDFRQALAALDQGLAADPWSEELWLLKGLVLIRLRDPKAARAALERSLNTNPQYLVLNPRVYRQAAAVLAMLYRQSGDLDAARRMEALRERL